MMGWRIALPLPLPLAMGLASPDVVGAAEHGVNMAISHADLNLAQAGDARRLQARVRSAIRMICVQPRQGLLASRAESRCRRTAMARAQGQIDRAVKRVVVRQGFAQDSLATTAKP